MSKIAADSGLNAAEKKFETAAGVIGRLDTFEILESVQQKRAREETEAFWDPVPRTAGNDDALSCLRGQGDEEKGNDSIRGIQLAPTGDGVGDGHPEVNRVKICSEDDSTAEVEVDYDDVPDLEDDDDTVEINDNCGETVLFHGTRDDSAGEPGTISAVGVGGVTVGESEDADEDNDGGGGGSDGWRRVYV